MQEYYVVRQPQPFQGAFPSMMPFMPPGILGQGPGFPGFPGFPGQGPGFPGPGPGPGFPGSGPGPGQGPGFPGQGPGGGAASGPPQGPPPSFTPSQASAQQSIGVLAVDPGAIRPCRFRYVYLWLDNGQQFWAWLIFVGGRSVAGWRWTGFTWVYFGIDTNRIRSFVCF